MAGEERVERRSRGVMSVQTRLTCLQGIVTTQRYLVLNLEIKRRRLVDYYSFTSEVPL